MDKFWKKLQKHTSGGHNKTVRRPARHQYNLYYPKGVANDCKVVSENDKILVNFQNLLLFAFLGFYGFGSVRRQRECPSRSERFRGSEPTRSKTR
jgi:hypothetical protein